MYGLFRVQGSGFRDATLNPKRFRDQGLGMHEQDLHLLLPHLQDCENSYFWGSGLWV